MEHEKLFTPVSEGLPKDKRKFGNQYTTDSEGLLVIEYGDITSAKYNFEDDAWFQMQGREYRVCDVTHWLDLSKLTTIEAAKELCKDAYDLGQSDGVKEWTNEGEVVSFETFMSDNFKTL